jgi:PKD repeat protein
MTRHITRAIRHRSRGQGIVEFALVFPVLLLFLMVAIDFGRVYLGWVNLQNMARIAANYAANNATDFATNNAATLASYQQQIDNDAAANNCSLPAGETDWPAPAFSGYDVGDTATVALSCDFGVITPVISNVLGDVVTVSASSQFPVKTGIIAASNTGGGGGTPVTASFSCTPRVGATPLTVQCSDESGGAPTSWSWTVTGPGGVTQTSNAQDPFFTLVATGSYSVELTVDNALGQPDSLLISNYIVVGTPSTVDFIADKNAGKAPLLVQFTDQSSGSPTTWAWDFDTAAGPSVDSTAQNPSHTYSQAGSYDVTLTVTNAAGTFSLTKQNFIVVDVADCTVPSFTGRKRNVALGLWTTAGFLSANFTNAPGAANGNFTVKFQSITAGSIVPCTSSIQVSDK